MTDTARLLIAGSEHNADMLYVSGMFVPDAFIVAGIGESWHGLFSPLEVDRAKKTSRLDEVHLDATWRDKATVLGRGGGLAATASVFLEEHGIRKLTVPGSFPLQYAEALRGWGFEVVPAEGSLFPERAVKNEAEIAQLAKAERLTRQSMAAAEDFLAATSIGNDGVLRHPDVAGRVKSAHLRRIIETFLIARGAVPSHTIVACGRESADPHQMGSGFLRAHQPIIVDIFPRLVASGYWGDMTRTFVKGRAPDALKRMYRTVREGQDIGLSKVCNGASGLAIHQAIQQHFADRGFITGTRRGRQVGFFHGTGHGVGLEVHEAPRISVRDDTLKAGQVVTVEPGLYYPDIGGIRLEDLVVVRDGGCDNLTRFRRRLEIP